MDWLHTIFHKSPESALFLSLAIGYAIGKITFGKFQLGGVAGSLLAGPTVEEYRRMRQRGREGDGRRHAH